jgi:hypothetical protein
MQTLSKVILLFLFVLLLNSMQALACSTPQPPQNLNFDKDPVVISLYNDPDVGDTSYFKLCVIDLSYPNNTYDVLFSIGESGDWQNFNTMFGPLTYTEFDMSESPSNTIDLNLRLYDGDVLVSNQAKVNFFSYDPQLTEEYSWYDWAVLNWLNEDGSELDVSTLLTTFSCGDPLDMVGTTAVPIPGTGLLLSFGILCLIGRRNNRKL